MKPRFILRSAASAAALLAGCTIGLAQDAGNRPDAASIEFQDEFDHIGAEVHSLDHEGRTIYYIDEGRADDRAVVFIGGAGTSLEAFQLTEFARTLRQQLGLRVISVERNGFGESEFDPELGYSDYNDEILAVLDHLGVDDFALMAISGGGAYAAQLAAAVPDRVRTMHIAVAVSTSLPTRGDRDCSASLEDVKARAEKWTHSPKDWWGVPGSPVLAVPGWQTTAYGDATRSFYVNGQLGDPSALAHEQKLPCSDDAVVDVANVQAPTYLYWGAEDTSVPVDVMQHWKDALPNIEKEIVYPNEGHTIQYTHWDQILVDMAGYGDHTVVCADGETKLVPNDEAGDAFRGLCVWERALASAPAAE